MIEDEQYRRMGMALSPSAGENLTEWTFLTVVAMADLSVVECLNHTGPSDGPFGRAPSLLTTARQEWFLWPSLFIRRRRTDLFCCRGKAARRERAIRDPCSDRVSDGLQAVILHSISDYRERPLL